MRHMHIYILYIYICASNRTMRRGSRNPHRRPRGSNQRSHMVQHKFPKNGWPLGSPWQTWWHMMTISQQKTSKLDGEKEDVDYFSICMCPWLWASQVTIEVLKVVVETNSFTSPFSSFQLGAPRGASKLTRHGRASSEECPGVGGFGGAFLSQRSPPGHSWS